jgi:hypothetical protein
VTDAHAMLIMGALGVLAAFVERRDGMRYVGLAERMEREIGDLRSRITVLEKGQESADASGDAGQPSRPWWAFWGQP